MVLVFLRKITYPFLLNSSNDNNGDSNHSSRGNAYNNNNTSSRSGGRQNAAPSHHNSTNGHLDRLSKGGHSKAAMQTTPTTHKGQDSPTAQPSNRKGRGSKAQNHSQLNQTQNQNQSQSQTHQESSQRRCSDDSDYSSLVEVMDRDLDRPESPATSEQFHEQSTSAQSTQSKGMLTN